MASIRFSEVRKGMVIVGEDGQLYYCVDRELKTPGNLPSKLRIKLKNLQIGSRYLLREQSSQSRHQAKKT